MLKKLKTFAIFFGVRCTWSSVNVAGTTRSVRVAYIPIDCTDLH